MAGTLISYQGHRCQSVEFNRTRGWASDVSSVVIVVRAFPDGFQFVTPGPGQATNIPDMQVPDLSAIRSGKRAMLDIKSDLRWAGTLTLAEAQDKTWQVVVHPLFVLRVELIKAAGSPQGLSLARVVLLDVRHLFASRGFIRRWDYNRTRGDGTVAADSLNPSGQVITKDRIAKAVFAELPSAPDLSAFPQSWLTDQSQVTFAPFSQAVLAAHKLQRESGLVDPCLRLDGTVAVHKQGDGQLGWARDGVGPNSEGFPRKLILWKSGRGPGFAIEATYRDDFVTVVGGLKIKTVQVDGADPVLVLENTVRTIDEDLIRGMTGGRWGVEELQWFVMQPRGKQSIAFLSGTDRRLFREQAYRLWRVAGVEKLQAFTPGPDKRPPVDSESELARPDFVAVAGPNAHLLAGPGMQDRAETTAGARWPVTVEAYTFEVEKPESFSFTEAGQSEQQAKERLAEIARAIIRAATRAGGTDVADPFLQPVKETPDEKAAREAATAGAIAAATTALPGPFQDAARLVATYWKQLAGLFEPAQKSPATEGFQRRDPGGVSWQDLAQKESRVRLIERIASIDPKLAKQFEEQTRRLFQARDAQHGSVESDLFDLAKKARASQSGLGKVEVGESAFQSLSREERGGGDAAAVAKKRLAEIQKELDRIGKKALGNQNEQATRERNAGASARTVKASKARKIYRNLPRHEVPATVFSARLGIVKTARVVGHLATDGVPDPSATALRPMPVRITFGAHVRPRLDRPPGGGATSTTLVRQSSEDMLSWFHRSYRRGDSGVERITLDEVPAGDGRVIPTKMVELIPLEIEPRLPTADEQLSINSGAATPESLGINGGGQPPNTAKLEDAASRIAAEFLNKPSQIKSATYVMARPWPVQCNGTVSAVTIRSRESPAAGTGFETLISVGDHSAIATGLGTTRERRRLPVVRGRDDAERREGLL